MGPKRVILIAAEDTDASAGAAAWVVKECFKDGADELELVYVVPALVPKMEVFIGLGPGTSFSFNQPGSQPQEWALINEAKARLEQRFLPVLKERMVPYQLQLYAERTDVSAQRVGELILKRAEEVDAGMVVLAAHNKPGSSSGFAGSVAEFIVDNCKRPLVLVRPKGEEAVEGEEEMTS